MNIIVLGPQGSGKGTQVELLVEKFGLIHFEAGKILRGSSDPIVQATLQKGELVPDELMRQIVTDFVSKNKNGGYIFDGYPRNLSEYQDLKEILQQNNQSINHVINIEISPEESVKRLLKRARSDDKPEAIQKRLSIYREQTHPVFEKAVGEGIGFEVDGEQEVEKVFNDVMYHLSLTGVPS